MSEYRRRMYLTSVSSSTIVLSPANGSSSSPGGGLGLAQATLVTEESTANAQFWGTTGTCGIYDVIIRKLD